MLASTLKSLHLQIFGILIHAAVKANALLFIYTNLRLATSFKISGISFSLEGTGTEYMKHTYIRVATGLISYVHHFETQTLR